MDLSDRTIFGSAEAMNKRLMIHQLETYPLRLLGVELGLGGNGVDLDGEPEEKRYRRGGKCEALG